MFEYKDDIRVDGRVWRSSLATLQLYCPDPAEKVKVSTDTSTCDSWKFFHGIYFVLDRFALDSLVAIVLGQLTLQ